VRRLRTFFVTDNLPCKTAFNIDLLPFTGCSCNSLRPSERDKNGPIIIRIVSYGIGVEDAGFEASMYTSFYNKGCVVLFIGEVHRCTSPMNKTTQGFNTITSQF